jgi:anaerobic magnesium-protoporphyrin IX monomethyl ester cyclase
MRILLVYANSMLENALPISISQLSACLKEAGFEVKLFDTTFYRWGPKSDTENRIEALQIRPCPLDYVNGDVYGDFIKAIEREKPDLIGLSVVEPTFRFGMTLLDKATEVIQKHRIRVAVGGIHAIFAPETISQYDFVDYICISEGERAFVELCQKIEQDKSIYDTRGFWLRNGKEWVKNERASIVDLDKLPPLDFSLFSSDYLEKPMMGKMYKTVVSEFSRGCPYRCSYCGDYALTRLFRDDGRWYREKDVKLTIDEIKQYIARYHASYLYIHSETFLTMKQNRFDEFIEGYRDIKIPFWFNTRPESVSEDRIRKLEDVGCHRISVGIEHGNEQFRRTILRRNYTNDQAIKALKILDDSKIAYSVNVMIGFPDETRDLVFDTIELCRKINPDGISTHIFSPYHGTELRDVSVQKGYIDKDLIADDFFQDYVLDQPSLTREQVLGLFRTIPLYIKFPKSEYPRIKRAERLDGEGNKLFQEFQKIYREQYF